MGQVLAPEIVNEHVRYEPEENPPPLIALGAGAQAALLIVAPVVLTVVVVVRIADAPESYLAWAIFAAMVVCGLTTVLQAARWGRFGSGHVLIMGTSGAFIAVCVAPWRWPVQRHWPALWSFRLCSSSCWRPDYPCSGASSRRL